MFIKKFWGAHSTIITFVIIIIVLAIIIFAQNSIPLVAAVAISTFWSFLVIVSVISIVCFVFHISFQWYLFLIALSLSLASGLLFSLYRCCCLIVTMNFKNDGDDSEKSVFINGKKYKFRKVDQKRIYFFHPGEYEILVEGDEKTHSVRLYPGETVSVVISEKS